MSVQNPPKPAARAARVSLWRHLRLFRRDILSAQPARLYRAWMAEFRTPFFRSYLINDPALIKRVLIDRPGDYPKSDRINAGLRPLLGNSVFVTNGAVWERQRRIIDPAFAGGRVRQIFPAMLAAAQDGAARLTADDRPQETEAITSHIAADVIFRTLFSAPITDRLAADVFAAFQSYQRRQPILTLAAFLPAVPLLFRSGMKAQARQIRTVIGAMVARRLDQIAQGTAPDDLATKLLTTPDPQTGRTFDGDEMVDQVAIFFLAGHETSGSALAWALYLLALYPDWQDRVAAEAAQYDDSFAGLSGLGMTRNVFRETLRLYPPVPMMVRQADRKDRFRNRDIARGSQIVISPWHLQRHERLWDNPDGFDPGRWAQAESQKSARDAYLPFSAGPRICPGAGFALTEGVIILAQLLRRFRVQIGAGAAPVPVAHLTVRSQKGIWLEFHDR